MLARRKDRVLVQPYRDIAALVGAQVLCILPPVLVRIALCARHSRKEYAVLVKSTSTFFVSSGIVTPENGILLGRLWDMIPKA